MTQLQAAAVASLPDADLLTRFVNHQDERAFETLVRRHGPLVLQVCRRILNNSPAADDAFQATFIVLMRKAASLAQKELLSHWLYKVAYRVALKARSQECRRHDRERTVAAQATAEVAPEHAQAEASSRDLRPVLDEEIARLPEKYRAPIVLSYLEGKTTDETASLLGWSRGTVATRLSRGRDLLRNRLARRGLAYTSAVLTALMTELGANAAVPESLLHATAQGVVGLAAGQSTTALTSNALTLAGSSLRFPVARLLSIVGTVAVVLLIGLGLTLVFNSSTSTATIAKAESPQESFLARWAAEQTLDEADGVIELPTEAAPKANRPRVVQALAFAPDGKFLAAGGSDGLVKVWDLSGSKLVLRLGQHPAPVTSVVFSPSSEYLAGVSTDHLIVLGNVKSRFLATFASKSGADVLALGFSSDSTQLLGGHKNGTLTMWDTRGQVIDNRQAGSDDLQLWAFAPHQPLAVYLDAQNSLTLWNYQTGQRTMLTRDFAAQSLAFATLAGTPVVLAVDARGQRVRTWHADTGSPVATLPWSESNQNQIVRSLTLGGAGKLIAWSKGDGRIQLRRVLEADSSR